MHKKNILCFGDSNTWGFVPCIFDYNTFNIDRYSKKVRWPGVMQNILGGGYYVIEEGLNGRTTNIEYPDIEGRSGTSYLNPCLYSHSPLDLVIIQLGINDLKSIFNRSIQDIVKGIEELIKIIKDTNYGPNFKSPPKILIVGPPLLLHEGYLDQNNELVFVGGVEKSKQFHNFFSTLAYKKDCYYLNLGDKVKVSNIDGLHLDENGHKKVGEIMASNVFSIFKTND